MYICVFSVLSILTDGQRAVQVIIHRIRSPRDDHCQPIR